MALNSLQVTIAIKPAGRGCRSVIMAGGQQLWQSSVYPASESASAVQVAAEKAIVNGWRVR
jgi:hypothetical protein